MGSNISRHLHIDLRYQILLVQEPVKSTVKHSSNLHLTKRQFTVVQEISPNLKRIVAQEINPNLKRKSDNDPPDLPPAKCQLTVAQEINTNLKRKSDNDPPDLPPAKCQLTVAQEINPNLKCKSDNDPPDLPPAKRQLTVTQEINPCKSDHDSLALPLAKRQLTVAQEINLSGSDLLNLPSMNRQSSVESVRPNTLATTSLLILPNELLHEIVDLLGIKELRTCTWVSTIFKNIAAPHYLAALNFAPTGDFRVSVNRHNCQALMVWRHMANFTRPRSIYCSLLQAKDCHMEALQIFFESTQCANIPVVYVSSFGNASPASTTALLASIRASGCQMLSYCGCSDPSPQSVTSFPKPSCMIPSRLESFSLDCNTVSAPPMISFTMSALHSSSLRDLVLQDTGLSSTSWGKLLRSLDLPLLRHLEVDPQCPVTALLKFLQRHGRVQSLCISTYGEPVKSRRSLPLLARLPSLHAIQGPPEYLTSLLCRLDLESVTSLSITFRNVKSGVSCILKVMDCAQYLPCLRDMGISFQQELTMATPVTALLVPNDESRTCRAIRLMILSAFQATTDTDEEIVKYCAPWMKSFPDVESVRLLLGAGNPSEAEMDGIRCSFMENAPNPDNLEIALST
ncbi:hypothetical protein BU15DRAFT_76635 [Melanogaster broomeanus]|nr:hypothetical protein BU15DRAFT_76635 [Melanogaster broomeanus]